VEEPGFCSAAAVGFFLRSAMALSLVSPFGTNAEICPIPFANHFSPRSRGARPPPSHGRKCSFSLFRFQCFPCSRSLPYLSDLSLRLVLFFSLFYLPDWMTWEGVQLVSPLVHCAWRTLPVVFAVWWTECFAGHLVDKGFIPLGGASDFRDSSFLV